VTPEHQERAQQELLAWQVSRQEQRRRRSQRVHSATQREGTGKGTPPDAQTTTE
jgi:hypothetical protein